MNIRKIAIIILILIPMHSLAEINKECLNKKITTYTKEKCIFCVKLKNILLERDLSYQNIDISNNITLFNWLVSATNQRTVPCFYG